MCGWRVWMASLPWAVERMQRVGVLRKVELRGGRRSGREQRGRKGGGREKGMDREGGGEGRLQTRHLLRLFCRQALCAGAWRRRARGAAPCDSSARKPRQKTFLFCNTKGGMCARVWHVLNMGFVHRWTRSLHHSKHGVQHHSEEHAMPMALNNTHPWL
eukprot:363722-Chlamydomonas_euryale.AAC.2